jgi:hypothetical protein
MKTIKVKHGVFGTPYVKSEVLKVKEVLNLVKDKSFEVTFQAKEGPRTLKCFYQGHVEDTGQVLVHCLESKAMKSFYINTVSELIVEGNKYKKY